MPNPPCDPRKRPRQARSRALVEAVLDAAAQILAQHGREALTTNAVALKAGVSIGSLYQYFPNRDAVIAAVADRHSHRIYHHVADLDLREETTLEGAVTRIVAALFAAHRIDPALHCALDGDLAHGPNGGGHLHHHHHAGTKDAMAMQIGSLRPPIRDEIRRNDIALAAVIVAELVHAMAHAAIVHPHENSASTGFEREATTASIAYLRTIG